MKFTNKHGWLLIAIAVWNFYSYSNFTRNLINSYQDGEDRSNGYYIAHTILIVVNVIIGIVLLILGIKALRANKKLAAAEAAR